MTTLSSSSLGTDRESLQYRWLAPVTGMFVAVLLMSNIASTKLMEVGPLILDGGTFIFPLSYIFGDILTEVYGYKRSRTVIWTGFTAAALMAVVMAGVAYMPPAGDWPWQEAFAALFGLVPRIVAASLVAYFVGEFANSFVMAKMKVWQEGKMLPLRTIGSTLVGQMFDTGLFVVIAFWGVVPTEVLWALIWGNYLFKVGTEVVMTPATLATVRKLKKVEREDYYDVDTKFSPFRLDS